jgi:hypothetical protein
MSGRLPNRPVSTVDCRSVCVFEHCQTQGSVWPDATFTHILLSLVYVSQRGHTHRMAQPNTLRVVAQRRDANSRSCNDCNKCPFSRIQNTLALQANSCPAPSRGGRASRGVELVAPQELSRFVTSRPEPRVKRRKAPRGTFAPMDSGDPRTTPLSYRTCPDYRIGSARCGRQPALHACRGAGCIRFCSELVDLLRAEACHVPVFRSLD